MQYCRSTRHPYSSPPLKLQTPAAVLLQYTPPRLTQTTGLDILAPIPFGIRSQRRFVRPSQPFPVTLLYGDWNHESVHVFWRWCELPVGAAFAFLDALDPGDCGVCRGMRFRVPSNFWGKQTAPSETRLGGFLSASESL